MCLLAVIIMQQLFWTTAWYLYSFTEEWRAKLFVQMFFVTQGTIATIMLGYLGFSSTRSNIMSLFGKKDESQTEKEE